MTTTDVGMQISSRPRVAANTPRPNRTERQ